jgi:hypothetical protein
MNKLSLLFTFISVSLFAQTTSITFTGSSFMYVKDRYVYVKNGIDLKTANNNLYLRNEGQLLQAGATTSQNKGLGTLSVFQEGTVNNFAYNVWCSPIGTIPALATTFPNTNFGITSLFRPTTNIASTVATNTTGLDGTTSATTLDISSRWIYTFRSGINYADWISIGAATTLAPGEGFTMKGTSGTDTANTVAIGEIAANNPGNAQRYDFRGKPNDGNITVNIAAGKQTMAGNPYSSAINLNYYLLENSGYLVNYLTGAYTLTGGPAKIITGDAEYWEQQKTPAPASHNLNTYVAGYGVYVPNNPSANSPGSYGGATWNTYNADGSLNTTGAATGSTYNRMFAPIGQGFLVNGFAAGTATMKNVYRIFKKESLGESVFERNANTTNDGNWEEIPNVAGVDYTQFSKAAVPQIKFHTIMNNQFSRETTLAFNPNTTDGYDSAMDAASSELDLPNDAYFTIGNTADKYIINTLPFQVDKRIPFTLKAGTETNFKITVANIINFTDAENVYLYDGVTNIYHDIKNDMFDITLPTGTHSNRFEVTFVNTTLANTNFNTTDISVFQNNTNSMLTITNPKLLDVTNVKLYDVAGKLIFNKENLNTKNNYEFSTSTLSDGVYIVKLNTKENINIAQKVIVSNVK